MRITAKLDRLTASEMCNKLGDLAGIIVAPADDNLFNDPTFQTGMFSAEWDKQTLWDCVREVCEPMNLHATPDRSPTNAPGIRLVAATSIAPPVSTDQIRDVPRYADRSRRVAILRHRPTSSRPAPYHHRPIHRTQIPRLGMDRQPAFHQSRRRSRPLFCRRKNPRRPARRILRLRITPGRLARISRSPRRSHRAAQRHHPHRGRHRNR